jgi:putative GTP pyrophosphokinase
MPTDGDHTARAPAGRGADQFDARYNELFQTFKALEDEARFVLAEEIRTANIKIHEIESRVKSLTSIAKKARDKDIADPFSHLRDIVGLRVICLFLSDLDDLAKVIRNSFDVLEVDDKLRSSTDSFGYMSVHYIVRMRDEYTGPRYRKIKGLTFEIQTRTLSMHAWAAISHYLDYKGEWDVPENLRKALNALSGLFYVADNQFEQFYKEARRSRAEIQRLFKHEPVTEQPVNFETVKAYLLNRFSDRSHGERASISNLVEELKKARYNTIGEVDRDVEKGKAAFAVYEERHPPGNSRSKDRRYADIGVVRGTLSIVNKAFLNAREPPVPKSMRNEFEGVADLVT